MPEPILDPDGEALNPIQRISLDMTVLCDSGRWYYAWQQVGSIWIASFDPDRPAKLASKPKQIVVPEFAWDNMIAEGPNAIVHDGTIFLIYSGSLVGIDYTTGLVTAPAGRGVDLTDASAWTKLDYPLQKSGMYNGRWQLGTGHGTVDKRLSSGYQRKLMMIFYGRDKSTTAADLDQMKKEIVGLKLKNEKSLVGQINIAKALLANNPNQLLTVCEKEVNNLSPEEFPFSIIAGAKEKATPLQINRWKKIGQKLVAKCEDKDMAKQMEQYIESMFAKK